MFEPLRTDFDVQSALIRARVIRSCGLRARICGCSSAIIGRIRSPHRDEDVPSPMRENLWLLTSRADGARKRTRTSTPLRAPPPEDGASTNSAIRARGRTAPLDAPFSLVNRFEMAPWRKLPATRAIPRSPSPSRQCSHRALRRSNLGPAAAACQQRRDKSEAYRGMWHGDLYCCPYRPSNDWAEFSRKSRG